MTFKRIAACLALLGMMALTACGVLEPVDTSDPTLTGGTVTSAPTTSAPTETADPTTGATATDIPTSPATSDVTTDPTAPSTDPTAPSTEPATGSPMTDGQKTVILDPGHGFVDPGASSGGIYEKDVNLACTLAVKAALEAKGYAVILTHDGVNQPNINELAAKCDQYGISYDPNHAQWYANTNFRAYERAIYAKLLDYENGADLFVSFHADAYPYDTSISRFGIIYCNETDYTAETERAIAIVDKVLENAFSGRRCTPQSFSWDEGYAVTKYPTCPSMLIEMGYMTTPADLTNLTDPDWQTKFAEAMADAIAQFLG